MPRLSIAGLLLFMTEVKTGKLFNEFVVPNYGRFPVAMARGEGARIRDEDGKEYLDFGAGIAVSTLGHAHPRFLSRPSA